MDLIAGSLKRVVYDTFCIIKSVPSARNMRSDATPEAKALP